MNDGDQVSFALDVGFVICVVASFFGLVYAICWVFMKLVGLL